MKSIKNMQSKFTVSWVKELSKVKLEGKPKKLFL